MASRGHRPFAGGGAGTEEPSTVFWDYLFSVSLAVGVICFGIALWALLTGRGGKAAPGKRDLKLLGIFFFGAFVLGLVLAIRALPRDGSSAQQQTPTLPSPLRPGGTQTGATPVDRAPELQWLPIAIIGVASMLVLAFLVARRRYRRRLATELTDEELTDELAALVEDTLDDLRAEPDPRRAVIAAYARMERVLAAYGVPRRHFEAPLEYLDRIASDLHVRQPTARRLVFELTHLFEQAKFSPHAIDAEMKDSAIETLTQLRDDLRAESQEAA